MLSTKKLIYWKFTKKSFQPNVYNFWYGSLLFLICLCVYNVNSMSKEGTTNILVEFFYVCVDEKEKSNHRKMRNFFLSRSVVILWMFMNGKKNLCGWRDIEGGLLLYIAIKVSHINHTWENTEFKFFLLYSCCCCCLRLHLRIHFLYYNIGMYMSFRRE